MTRGFTPSDEQTDAIEAPLTPQLLVAGAGAGKTTVMAHRILHVVQSGQARADQILALTFTNKAAQHLKQRVREVLGPDADATIATYHSFGASLVAEHALELDLAPGTRLLNRAESWQLLFAVFDEFRFDRRSTLSPEFVLTDALNLASRAADHLVPVEAIVADCHDVQAVNRWKKMTDTAASRLELCQVVAAYGRRKRACDLLDFDDQVGLAVRLLTDHPQVADDLRLRHPVVLLDEYQDTNFAQRRLLQLVYPACSAITAVGDDMQSIYAFRGAHLANILSFPQHFPPATPRPLQTTFRFGAALSTLANRIQGKVEHSLSKTLTSGPDVPGTTIECFLAADDTAEAAAIADDIARRGPKWSDSAVLCRKRRLIGPIVDALQKRDVPVEAVGTSGLLDRPEIVDLVAWLEVLADPSASVALLRILTGPRYRIGLRDLAALARHGRELDPSGQLPKPDLIDAVCDVDESGWSNSDVSFEAQERLHRFEIERRALGKLAARLPVVDLAEAILVRADLWPAAGPLGRENLLRLLDLAERFQPVEGDPGLAAFVEYLQLLDESEEDLAEAHLSDTDAVRVMTIHQAKGLEFPSVYVPGLAGKGSSKIFPDGRPGENAVSNSSALPWWLREDDEGIPSWRTARMADIDDAIRRRKLDEEWRLLYVACTRAQQRLVCSAAHWYRGAAEPQGPSGFYTFVAGQTDLVTERFRQEPAEVDPEVAAKERYRAAAARRYPASMGPPVARQLTLDDLVLRVEPARAAASQAPAGTPGPVRDRDGHLRPVPQAVLLDGRAAAPPQLVGRGPARNRGPPLDRATGRPPARPAGARSSRPPASIRTCCPSGAGVAARLKASFLASPYAELDPVKVEAPFALAVADELRGSSHLVRGRIDAVYERDGRLELVDFKTGRPDGCPDQPGAAMQLDLYGLAAIGTWDADPERLRTTYCWLRPDGPPVVDSHDWDPVTATEVRKAGVSRPRRARRQSVRRHAGPLVRVVRLPVVLPRGLRPGTIPLPGNS